MVRAANKTDVLSLFSAPVAKWFAERHGTATEPQVEAWPLIKRGDNVLIHSPTGSGKTLAAFLSALDGLYSDVDLSKQKGVRTLYISPLKALGYDVERNLEDPMKGIVAAANDMGLKMPDVRADVRTGDTPSSARARMLRNPPHVLITTPESLYLILTSPRASEMLQTVETVIVDEIHTLCANKRGVHLSITLERLEQIAPGFQRIGLSATQRPLSEVARLLGGQSVETGEGENEGYRIETRPVSIVDCPGSKQIEVSVHGMPEAVGADPGSVWPKLIPRVLDDIDDHDTTLVFANSRRQAENTAERLNAEWMARERGGEEGAAVGNGVIGSGEDEGPFLAHHGSLSDTLRREIEKELKAGRLPALVGTSSLELGIDIGSIDLVVQLQSPKTVTQGLQRIGRAGHSVGAVSTGKIYATHPEDLIEAAVVAKGVQERRVEEVSVPRNSLDVLAQQVVASVAVQDWAVPELYRLVRGAYPYEKLSYENFLGVVKLVSGHYPRELFSALKARVHWDQTRDILEQLPGTRMMAISNGGAIVDRGAFPVLLPDRKTRIGELDEEFVLESGEGDAFMLGSQVWRVAKIEDDRLIAEPAPGAAPRMPFWRGDFPWRPLDLSYELASFRSAVAERVRPYIEDEIAPDDVVEWLQTEYLIDPVGARQIIDYVRRQLRWSGEISSEKTIIVETFQDSIGDLRIVVHSPFGGRINGPWSVAISRELIRRKKIEPEVQVSDDGMLFRLPQADDPAPADFIRAMTSEDAKELILVGMIDSPLFGAVFRQNAYRALLLPGLGQFRRTPFWLQRLRSKDLLAIAKSLPDFPIVLETYRDALEDFMDMPGLGRILDDVQSGAISMRFVESDVPSPVARALEFNFNAHFMYQWDTPKAERGLQALDIDRDALALLFKNPEASGLLRPEAINDVSAQANRSAAGMKVRTATELAQLLVEIGDLTDEEIADRSEDGWRSWIERLSSQGRAQTVEFDIGDETERRWVATELAEEYREAVKRPCDFGSARRVVARYLARSGPVPLAVIEDRYPIERDVLNDVLDELMADARVARGYFTDTAEEEWLDLSTLARIQERTLAILRSEVRPSDPMDYQSAVLRRHGICDAESQSREEAHQSTCDALSMLQGVPIPVHQWVRDVLPARVGGFTSGVLNDVVSDGEFQWIFCRNDPSATTQLAFVRPGEARGVLPSGMSDDAAGGSAGIAENASAVLEFISGEGVVDSETLLAALGTFAPHELAELVKRLALMGLVTADSWSVAMSIANSVSIAKPTNTSEPSLQLRSRRMAHRRSVRRQFYERRTRATGILVPGVNWSSTGRFSFLGPPIDEEKLSEVRALALLGRHGVVTKRAIEIDQLGWEWRPIYRALSLMELRGKVRRGYFVNGLPGVQFADSEIVDLMREPPDQDEVSAVSALDPAYIFDRRLAAVSAKQGSKLCDANRVASTRIGFCNGQPAIVTTSNGARFEVGDVSDEILDRVTAAMVQRLAAAAPDRRVVISEWDGAPVLSSDGAELLAKIGFRRDYPNMVFDALSMAIVRH